MAKILVPADKPLNWNVGSWEYMHIYMQAPLDRMITHVKIDDALGYLTIIQLEGRTKFTQKLAPLDDTAQAREVPRWFLGRYGSDVLWFSRNSIIRQTIDQFHEDASKSTFSYMGETASFNRLYFMDDSPLVQLLPLSGYVVICGMAHGSVIGLKTSHWDTESCVSIWDIRTGELLFYFFPEYAFGDFFRIICSSDERFLVISQLYESEDIYVVDIATKRVLLHTSGRICQFRHDNSLIIFPSVGWDGPNGGLRIYNPSTSQMIEIFSKEAAYEKGLDIRDAILDEDHDSLFALCDHPDTRVERFSLTALLKGIISCDVINSNKTLAPSCIALDSMNNRIFTVSEELNINRISFVNTNPKMITGKWAWGWALDIHTTSSVYIGVDEFGHDQFDNTYSEVGLALFKLKYRNDKSQFEPLAQTAANFVRNQSELSDLCAIIAVPPSTIRQFQPVVALALAIGKMLNLQAPTDYLIKSRKTTALKGVNDTQKRHAELQGAFKAVDERFRGGHVLLFDDLFRSGETLNAICDTLISQGKVGKISVLTVTMTRRRR